MSDVELIFKKVYLEGNIGSGKTTLINMLKKDNLDIGIFEEPVKIWTDIGIFQKYGIDPVRYGLMFQVLARMTRHNLEYDVLADPGCKLVNIFERSGLTDETVFMPVMADLHQLDKEELLWYDTCVAPLNKSFKFLEDCEFGFIYLNTSPEICEKRILKRNRTGENVSFDYLLKLDEKHRTGLLPKIRELTDNVLIIDGDQDFINNEMNRTKVLLDIYEFINSF